MVQKRAVQNRGKYLAKTQGEHGVLIELLRARPGWHLVSVVERAIFLRAKHTKTEDLNILLATLRSHEKSLNKSITLDLDFRSIS